MTDQELKEELKNKIVRENLEAYRSIRDVFNTDYGINELSYLKRRIEYCIIYDEFLSAMLTTNYLLEYFCKISLIYNYVNKNEKENITIDSHPFAPTEELEIPTDLYDEKILGNNIDKMKKEGLIDENDFDQLVFFKNIYRNILSHANRKKLYENISIPIESITIENDELVSKGIKFEKLYLMPFADFKFLDVFTKQNCIPYFLELHTIIMKVVEKIITKNELPNN